MRLIDADALGIGFCKPELFNAPGYADGWNAAISILQNAPTVDPVKHGRWIGEGDGYADGEIVCDVWHCSECGYCIDDGTDDPDLLPSYCPGCGAKMDGGTP